MSHSNQYVQSLCTTNVAISLQRLCHTPPPPASCAFLPVVQTVSGSAVWPPPQPVICTFQPSEHTPVPPPCSSLHLSSALYFPQQTLLLVFQADRNKNVKHRAVFMKLMTLKLAKLKLSAECKLLLRLQLKTPDCKL